MFIKLLLQQFGDGSYDMINMKHFTAIIVRLLHIKYSQNWLTFIYWSFKSLKRLGSNVSCLWNRRKQRRPLTSFRSPWPSLQPCASQANNSDAIITRIQLLFGSLFTWAPVSERAERLATAACAMHRWLCRENTGKCTQRKTKMDESAELIGRLSLQNA